MVGQRKAGGIGEQRSGQDSMMLGAAPGVRAVCTKERVRQGSKEREIQYLESVVGPFCPPWSIIRELMSQMKMPLDPP